MMASMQDVDMVAFKRFAEKYLKKDSVLREIIMAEPDMIPSEEYLPKLKVFYRLLEREYPRK